MPKSPTCGGPHEQCASHWPWLCRMASASLCRLRSDIWEPSCRIGVGRQGRMLCERIQKTQLPRRKRANLVASLVVPRATYSSAVGASSKEAMASLRAACARAIWGQGNSWRAQDILFTLFCKGHICDPLQADAYSALRVTRQVLRRHPSLVPMFEEVWDRRKWADSCPRSGGPVAALLQACRTAGVEMPHPGTLRCYSPEGELSEMSLLFFGDWEI